MDYVYKLHELPATIVSYRDPFFLSHFWKQVFNQHGVDLHYFTVYPPQTDGRTEIVNKCLENYLCCMVGEILLNGSSGYLWLKWGYNTNFHFSTKTILYEILYSLKPPIHVPYIPKDSVVATLDTYLTTRKEIHQAHYS